MSDYKIISEQETFDLSLKTSIFNHTPKEPKDIDYEEDLETFEMAEFETYIHEIIYRTTNITDDDRNIILDILEKDNPENLFYLSKIVVSAMVDTENSHELLKIIDDSYIDDTTDIQKFLSGPELLINPVLLKKIIHLNSDFKTEHTLSIIYYLNTYYTIELREQTIYVILLILKEHKYNNEIYQTILQSKVFVEWSQHLLELKDNDYFAELLLHILIFHPKTLPIYATTLIAAEFCMLPREEIEKYTTLLIMELTPKNKVPRTLFDNYLTHITTVEDLEITNFELNILIHYMAYLSERLTPEEKDTQFYRKLLYTLTVTMLVNEENSYEIIAILEMNSHYDEVYYAIKYLLEVDDEISVLFNETYPLTYSIKQKIENDQEQ